MLGIPPVSTVSDDVDAPVRLSGVTAPTFDPASWRPANEAELIMYHALLRRDSERFFRTVVDAPLYLAAVAEPVRQLVTWEGRARRHVLAFTSPEWMARVVGTEADTVLKVDYPLMSRDWPDPDWWLALNPALPIQATLPVTDVGPAADGELEVAMPPYPPALGLLLRAEENPFADAPADETEEQLARLIAAGNTALVLDLLTLTDVLLPTLRPVHEQPPALDDPYFPWAAMPLVRGLPVDGEAVGVFTSEQRLADATPGTSVPTVRVPLLDLAAAWPGPEYALLVNPHTSLEVRLPGEQVPALIEWSQGAAHYWETAPS